MSKSRWVILASLLIGSAGAAPVAMIGSDAAAGTSGKPSVLVYAIGLKGHVVRSVNG